ncbi:MAG: hypothetical protein R8G66_34835 [Cytophagales bacterium]|nr:hypothetical protein [Cytophagales bacterium]
MSYTIPPMLYRLTLALAVFWPVSSIDQQVKETCDFLVEEVVTNYPNDDASLAFTLAIAAPEYIRYRELSNLMEVQALRLMYAALGSGQVDFSVGYFQMKPSFIETLEDEIRKDEQLQNEYADLIGFYASDATGIRQERIDRILNIEYSVKYLQAFEQLIKKQYAAELEGLTDQQSLHFIATAYNLGLGKSGSAIRLYQTKQNFPHGPNFNGDQHAFGDISIRIYSQLNKLLCIPNH